MVALPQKQATQTRSRINLPRFTRHRTQKSKPRSKRIRGTGLLAVHDSTLAAGFEVTPVIKLIRDRTGRFIPFGLMRGRITRLDRHSSQNGYYCGLIHVGDDPREMAMRHQLDLHHMTTALLFAQHGFCEETRNDELDLLDLCPVAGGQ
ncbi:hypothetical protein [Rhodopirellula bahusiensis]|nr:hypothetical protein [Rhodopirellula bahusiensis]